MAGLTQKMAHSTLQHNVQSTCFVFGCQESGIPNSSNGCWVALKLVSTEFTSRSFTIFYERVIEGWMHGDKIFDIINANCLGFPIYKCGVFGWTVVPVCASIACFITGDYVDAWIFSEIDAIE